MCRNGMPQPRLEHMHTHISLKCPLSIVEIWRTSHWEICTCPYSVSHSVEREKKGEPYRHRFEHYMYICHSWPPIGYCLLQAPPPNRMPEGLFTQHAIQVEQVIRHLYERDSFFNPSKLFFWLLWLQSPHENSCAAKLWNWLLCL